MTREFAALTAALLIGGGFVCCAAGCSSGRRTDALEARLRVQEDRLLETTDALENARTEAANARRTVARLQAESQRPAAPADAPAKLAFASLLTGGIDEDGVPGDEAIRAVIQPLTEDGVAVRSPGRLEVELLDVAAAPEDRVRGRWTLEGEELHEQWDDGLFASGYTLELSPESDDLPRDSLLIARFQTPDGRQVESTRTVRLRPAGESAMAAFDAAPDSVAAVKTAAADAADQVQAVSATARQLSDAVINADMPPEWPMRQPPADEETNPFVDFEARRPVVTSDVWTDATIPTLR